MISLNQCGKHYRHKVSTTTSHKSQNHYTLQTHHYPLIKDTDVGQQYVHAASGSARLRSVGTEPGMRRSDTSEPKPSTVPMTCPPLAYSHTNVPIKIQVHYIYITHSGSYHYHLTCITRAKHLLYQDLSRKQGF